ncbi:PREDICTED: calcium-activated chloride channel regulator 4-like [Condylura cristata]|uniref:calcium-activated chloride channel regulator 4-like n=1 Tax=Condylura cristata TaxID=143302 RepID=UPI000642A0E6|nr:PREDICTED: calcium-activated chloride channel regulator 4-like [Condylura cristata]
MGLFRSSVLFLVLYLLQRSNTSLVRVSDNGYENVIIAIDPDVPEDETLIGKIENMVTEASTYLFEATGKRLFFKTVSILIPEKWKGKPQYKKPKQESYTHADVKVAPPAHPGDDEPYTRQFTECGEKGEFIHLTPDFVLGKKQKEYGPSGRLLVHEWAHLRWGVFDEYNENEPYYAAKSKKIEATRCSTGITGTNKVLHCQGDSCIEKTCRIDSKTKLYEEDCQFFPDQVQTEKASIMYMQAIDSVTQFCDKKHNREAPTLQNKKCNSRSTWEVIRTSDDLNNTKPLTAPHSPPIFSLLRISERIVCLVLDTSGSMQVTDRLNRMNQAAKYFLQEIIEKGSFVGMVRFDSSALVLSELTQITSETERNTLMKLLPTVADGGTSICSGIDLAFTVFAKRQLEGSEIVLLTDGEDSSVGNCVDRVGNSGAIVHFVALGPSADERVIEMSIRTGGKYRSVTDIAQNNGLVDAFAALSSANADISQQPLQLESKGLKLNNNEWMNDTVIIDSTVGKDTSFLITWKTAVPDISLWDPNGKSIKSFNLDKASKMAYLRIPEAMVGLWTYSVQAKAHSEILTITVNSRASSSSVPPIRVNAKMNKEANSYPNPMIVYAEVLQGYTPILGANVTAFIESQNGNAKELQLLDNGAGADAFKNDGVYSKYFTAYSENGKYNLKIRVNAGTSATRSFRHHSTRAAFIPGWVVNGKIEANPPRPKIENDTQTTLESFSRTTTGGAFVVSNVPSNPSSYDPYPPNPITDLEATRDEDEISLTWTAPGDDFDVGKVEQYIIRISGDITDLKDKFDDAMQLNTTDLLPKEANSKETFIFKQGNTAEENATHIFIAIQSVDKSNLTSKISNIAQVALFIAEADTDGSHPNSGINISALVLIVVGSVAAVCIIISTTVCVLKKKRNSSRPSTGF